uniref:persulfide dioxygenase n=1 Tax=Chrysotila carterae TaxID=13221 RepID=A0A7S4BKI1_CHRCT
MSAEELSPVEEVKKALDGGALVIDIRAADSSDAFKGIFSVVDGSISAPWDRANKTMPLSAFPEDKTATIVLHCNSGRRVNAAVPFLKEKGYINLLNAGGPAESEVFPVFGERIHKHDFETVSITQLFDGPKPQGGGSATYTYILADSKTKEAIIIDPVLEQVDRDLEVISSQGLTLTQALNTHCHADHITGTGELKKRVGGLRSAISAASGAKADVMLKEGESICWSDGRPLLRVLSTPGHTNGCVSFVCEPLGAVFTGDVLLIGGCGRTDFQEGSAADLYDSVHNKLFTLPDDTIVYPAHDYKGRLRSTIKAEKTTNPRLTKSKQEFVEIMANLNLPYPDQIDRALPANLVCGC